VKPVDHQAITQTDMKDAVKEVKPEDKKDATK
jgi:hypothetical protein